MLELEELTVFVFQVEVPFTRYLIWYFVTEPLVFVHFTAIFFFEEDLRLFTLIVFGTILKVFVIVPV